MWDNSVVYSRTNTFVLLEGSAAGGKCLDSGTNVRFFPLRKLGHFSRTGRGPG